MLCVCLAQVPMLITEGGVVVLRCTAAQLPHAASDTIPHWVSQARSVWRRTFPLAMR